MTTTGLRRALLAGALLLAAGRPADARPQASRAAAAPVVRAATIGEVLSGWRPGTHLFVLGDVGLSEDALQELATGLADTHWTVLLVQDATGQTYKDADGGLREGVDAIEYGTGQGLPQRPGFAAQVHPRTREADGAILSIVLAQRALYYTASAAQDTRGLGEDRFAGNLDQWAIAALRGGGDVAGAVRETVAQIDRRLTDAIEAEVREAAGSLARAAEQLDRLDGRSRELAEACPGGFRRVKMPDLGALRRQLQAAQAAAAQGRSAQVQPLVEPILAKTAPALAALDTLATAVDRARRDLAATEETLAALDQKAAGLRASHPELTGALARPDLETFRQRLQLARWLLPVDPEEAAKAAEVVGQEAGARVRAIDEYPAQGQALAAAETRLAGLDRKELAGAARESLLAARQGLRAARELYATGTFGYGKKIEEARAALDTAERQISAAEEAVARGKRLRRSLLTALVLGLLGLGVFLNRRRRGAKSEAERLLADWRTALDRKLEIVYDELEQRVARFVGPADGEGRRPHAGETLRLAGEIRADVGSLSILWVSANSVLQTAEALVRARGLAALVSFFSPRHYRRAIALLHDEPVPFDPADGLPRLFGSERTWRQDLLGDLESYAPFRKSFAEIVGELNLRAGRAAAALDRIEAAIVQGPAERAETGARLGAVAALREPIESGGAADGLFRLPGLFTLALPAAEAARARADELAATDPVTAQSGDGARARRIAVEAAQLARLVLDARRGALAAVAQDQAELREAAIETAWIEAARRELGGTADRLAEQLAAETVAAEAETLAQGLAALGTRTARAAALCRVLQATARPEIDRVTALVATARVDLAAGLGLTPEQLLHEEGADPSLRLAGSATMADAAHQALGRGDLDAAEAALAEAARLAAEAVAIVEAARQACASYAATDAARQAETARIEALLPEHAAILAGLQGTYAPSVLFLRAGDPDHPDANGTLTDNLEEARTQVRSAHDKRERAAGAHRGGAVLTAADLLEEVGRHQELAVHRLSEIAEKRDRLARTVETNRSLLEALESREREDEIAVAGDPRSMRPTLVAFEEGKHLLQKARGTLAVVPGDPFLAEADLRAAQGALDRVHDDLAPQDRRLHAEAGRSLQAAEEQLAAARALERRTSGDAIPDSAAIHQARTTLDSLERDRDRARAALQAAHGDWPAVDVDADRTALEGARVAAQLQGEIAAGERAVAAVESAARGVREAQSWRGAYGVTTAGDAGADALYGAKSQLAQGRYLEAAGEAERALHTAAAAVAAAQARVRALQEEEERREAARRRAAEERSRRAAAAASISRPSSSFGSGGSTSSGSSGSSWGHTGSGSGKSGW